MPVQIDAEPALGERLAVAIDDAIAHESKWSREPSVDGSTWGVHGADPPPWNRLLGPVSARGPASGAIVHRGWQIAQWGEPSRADLTFSVAKTYLALLAGIAVDRGLIDDPDEPVRARLPGIGFDSPHNAPIRWTHLLQQTSEWEGTCLGIPEQVDRWRWLQYQPGEPLGRKGGFRKLQPPGSFFEYNDVRINQLSLALLHLLKKPLPAFFRERILEPCGCSDPFRWDGYAQGMTVVGGVGMLSVPGGSHWGGGVSISARDQARIAQMMLANGVGSHGARVISSGWLAEMRKPCAVAPFYGMLLWLNTARAIFPSASEQASFALGAGSSVVWIDPGLELVVVLRWIEATQTNACLAAILAALPG